MGAKLKLKPCPFCGGQARIFGNDGDHFYVACTNEVCFCVLGEMYLPGDEPDHMFGDEESAAHNWNKRPEVVEGKIDTTHNTRKPKR